MVIETLPGLLLETSNIGSALFSEDKIYRYRLTRALAPNGPTVLFGLQNPSKATAFESDNTITRCIGFSKRLGAGRMVVVNMGAFMATYPKDFLKAQDPIGPMNREILAEAGKEADIAIAAWGALSKAHKALFRLSIGAFKKNARNLKCFGKTEKGDPRHPLYLPADAELVDF